VAPNLARGDRPGIEPFPAQHICYLCYDARRWDAAPCPPDVERECARLRSDLKGPPTITWVEGRDE